MTPPPHLLSGCRQQAPVGEELHNDAVPKAEPGAGARLAAEGAQQAVVAPPAKDRAQLPRAVAPLEHDACALVEAYQLWLTTITSAQEAGRPSGFRGSVSAVSQGFHCIVITWGRQHCCSLADGIRQAPSPGTASTQEALNPERPSTHSRKLTHARIIEAWMAFQIHT